MSQAEHLIYTVRPDGRALWLPALLAESLRLAYGACIPKAVYDGHDIQGLIARRQTAEKGGKGR